MQMGIPFALSDHVSGFRLRTRNSEIFGRRYIGRSEGHHRSEDFCRLPDKETEIIDFRTVDGLVSFVPTRPGVNSEMVTGHSPLEVFEITTQATSRSGRVARRKRLGVLGDPKTGGLIGVISLVLTLIGVVVAFLSWQGDKDERDRAARPTAAGSAGTAGVSENGTRATVSSSADTIGSGSSPHIPPPSTRPSSGISDPRVYYVFDLPMRGGYAYDIDVDTDRPPNYGSREASTDDLYRSRLESNLKEWQLYVPQAPKRKIKRGVFQVMEAHATPVDCLKLRTTTGSDSIDAVFASVGTKACVLTGQGRWAMISITGLPKKSDEFLRIKVTLLRL